MFNAEIAEVSFMYFSHVVTEHAKRTKWWYFITDLTTVLQQRFISKFDFFTAESNLELPL